MKIEDKITLLDGKNVWQTKELPNIPSIMMSDGPHGLRKQVSEGDNLGIFGSLPATCYPTASLTACSFDRKLIEKLAKHIAIEAQTQQVNIVLGPGINIKRTPLCGRNFEYFSEDPHLTGELAARYVKTVEEMNVGTSVKHFFANNHENGRFYMDSVVDDRALNEIYLKAFKRVIKENPATVMTSYNKINGIYGTEHPIIENVLRKQWNYNGVIVSDWGAIDNRINSLKAGTDLEMPSRYGSSEKLLLNNYPKDKDLEEAINKSSSRIIAMVDKYKTLPKNEFDIQKHHQIAREIARESMVLLKNENILPLNKIENIALIGGFIDNIRYQGGGSSNVNPTILEQFIDVYPNYSNKISCAKGYSLNKPSDKKLIKEAINLASKSEKVIYLMGLPTKDENEGFDRDHLNLPINQIELLDELLKVNDNIVVVVLAGSVVNLSFEPKVKGLLFSYLAGQAAARAIFDNLYGISNPSGRLAETFIDDIKQSVVDHTKANNSYHYNESIFVGYRYYSSYNIPVRYPFGYGLSYTKFRYNYFDVKIIGNKIHCIVEVENIGKYHGYEVIQIYHSFLSKGAYRAKKALSAFDKVWLYQGERKRVELVIDIEDFKIYDRNEQLFYLEGGKYEISLSSNVNDVIMSKTVVLDGLKQEKELISYNKKKFDSSSFPSLFNYPIPPLSIKKKRPFTQSSTLADLRTTFLGRIVSIFVLKEAKKVFKGEKNSWQYEVMKKTILESPIRTLISFGGGQVTKEMGDGIVDFANFRIFRGLKKIIKRK